jgi:2-haloacid dehalogenase
MLSHGRALEECFPNGAEISSVDASAPVEAVVFDVGRVLFRWNFRCLFEKLIHDPDELDWFLANVVTEEWHVQHDTGLPLSEMLPQRIALYPGHAALIEAYAERYNETIPGFVPGVLELVEQLHATGMPLYCITNFGADLWPAFRAAQPVFDRFVDIVVSGVEKVAKPDPAIFALAARRFGRAPGSMLFIDDNPANTAAAGALGWQVHHFNDSALLREALRARGLLPLIG